MRLSLRIRAYLVVLPLTMLSSGLLLAAANPAGDVAEDARRLRDSTLRVHAVQRFALALGAQLEHLTELVLTGRAGDKLAFEAARAEGEAALAGYRKLALRTPDAAGLEFARVAEGDYRGITSGAERLIALVQEGQQGQARQLLENDLVPASVGVLEATGRLVEEAEAALEAELPVFAGGVDHLPSLLSRGLRREVDELAADLGQALPAGRFARATGARLHPLVAYVLTGDPGAGLRADESGRDATAALEEYAARVRRAGDGEGLALAATLAQAEAELGRAAAGVATLVREGMHEEAIGVLERELSPLLHDHGRRAEELLEREAGDVTTGVERVVREARMLTTGLHALVVVMLLVGAVGPWLLTLGLIRPLEVQSELAAIVGSSDDAITGQAPDGTIVSWNDGAERLFGYTAGEVKGRPLSVLLPAGRSSEIEELLERVGTGERVHHHETECARKDGTTFVGFLTISPIRDARGCVTGTSAITRDVSDRMTAEAGLRASEERLRAVLQSASDAFVAVDASGTILEWNSQAARSFGWAPEEAIGLSLADTIIPPRHREEVFPALQRLLETSEGRLFLPQVELVHRDGRELLVEITVWPTPAGGTRIFNACIRDVSARRRTEGFLRLQRAMAAAANEAAGIEEALARCLEEVGASMGWPVGHALLVARGSGALESAGVWHMDDPGRYEAFRSETEASSLTGGKGLPGRVLETGQPIWIADVTRDPGFQRARVAQDVGLRAALGIPVLVGAEVVAVLEFFWPQPAEPDDEVIEVLMHVGTQLGRVAERSAAQETLRASEERYRLLFESNPLPMWVYDVDTLAFLAVNDAAVAHYGYTREEFLSMAIADIRPAEEARGLLAEALGEPRAMLKGLWRHRKKNGSVVDVEVSSHGVVFGGRRGRLVLANDVTERQMLEAQLTQQALHDPLTGLANRALYRDRVEHALAAGIRAQKQCAALFIDLDNFKTVNDSLGHAAGDELLKAVADRLVDCLRPEDTISRLGGDEFAILLHQAGEASAVTVAQRVVDVLQAPFPIQEKEFFVTGSVGIAAGRPDTHTAEELMQNADLAMYAAKARGKGGYQVFEPSMQAEALQRLRLEADLRHAAERGELFIHYQPVVMLQPIRIAGVEALVRWAHPERGVVAPADFIPIAEETGLILKIGVHVLQEACRQTMAWQLEHEIDPPLGVSVNVSPRQLRGEGLVGDVTRALADSGLPPGSLTLEITEGVLMQDTKSTMAKLCELKGLGVRLAIDDFGTGYSSLGYLRRFPIDVLKMDRSFTKDVTAETEDSSLARAIIRLGTTLQLDVVAEGVEELEQVIALERLGCRYAQGYYFSKPIGPTEVSELLARASAPHGGRLRTAGTVSEGAAQPAPPGHGIESSSA